MRAKSSGMLVAGILVLGCKTSGQAQNRDGGADIDAQGGSVSSLGVQCQDFQPLGNLYWGDLHSHTSYSFDSYIAANRNDPKDAYAFARGATVPIAAAEPPEGGVSATIDRPLDFLAVTDHSEFLDATGACVLGGSTIAGDPYCTSYLAQGTSDQQGLFIADGLLLAEPNPSQPTLCDQDPAACVAAARTAWQMEQQATAAAYDPCKFTSLYAYEWTAQTGTANLHRNVIFSSSAVPDVPLDYLDYPTPLDLWQGLDAQCKEDAGCDAITIPHNSNASYGEMWDSANQPAAIPYMERYQTLVEIFQHKGNSECLPGDVLSDPDCNFEIVPGTFLGAITGGTNPPAAASDAGGDGYVRPGLARGLGYAATHGDDPLRMGIVGATDTHDGTPGNVSEQGWPGHLGMEDATPEARLGGKSLFNPGGITAVWARQNTREEIFAALKRRETYATSGPRIVLRFYVADGLASQAAAEALCDDPSFPAALVAAGGSPMGAAVKGLIHPYLFVYAMKDEAKLDQIDVVKLSSDPSGNVALHVEPFPLTEGAQTKACVAWSDPDYAPAARTLYYARVRQAATWRWSHYDCLAIGGCDGGGVGDAGALDTQIQEKAWSSPIFVDP